MVISKSSNSENNTCPCYKGSHNLASCPQFRDAWSVDERCRWMRENFLCYNCFSLKHWSNRCNSKARCTVCFCRHHALLNMCKPKAFSNDATLPVDAALCALALSSHHTDIPLTVLFHSVISSALIHVRDRSGTWQVIRTLVDSAL